MLRGLPLQHKESSIPTHIERSSIRTDSYPLPTTELWNFQFLHSLVHKDVIQESILFIHQAIRIKLF